jgi:hypothetical protein
MAMRAFMFRFAAPLFAGAALFTMAAPAHAAIMGGTGVHPADCPASTHWDNTLNECVPD